MDIILDVEEANNWTKPEANASPPTRYAVVSNVKAT